MTLIGEPDDLERSPCKERKKNSLSLTIGPPKVKPNWLNRTGSFFTPSLFRKNLLASVTSLRMYSQPLPCQALVPDLVTRFTVPPALLPYCEDIFSCNCWNSSTVSWIGTLTAPPLRPLLDTPLIRNPLKSSRTPLTTVLWPFSKSTPVTLTAPVLICIKSNTLRPFKGKLAICAPLTVVASLESSVLTAAAAPVTSTISRAWPIVILTSTCAMVPAFIGTSVLETVLKPAASTDTLYVPTGTSLTV